MTGAVRPIFLRLLGLALAVTPPCPSQAEDTFQLPPIEAFSAMVDRPLFDPSRHPAPPSAKSEPAGAVSGASLRLAGLVKGENGRVIALVAIGDVKTVTRVGVGSSLNGWTVTRINGRGIDLAFGAQTAHVRLKEEIPVSP